MTAVSIPSTAGVQFSRGAVARRDLIFLLAQDGAGSRVIQYKQGRFKHRNLPWGAAALAADAKREELVVVGVDGEAMRATRSGFEREVIDASPEGPRGRGLLRDARLVGGRVYAVGMGRQVYRRDGPGRWSRVDAGLLAARGEVAGLQAIDGASASELYAAGLSGEIWRYDGAAWTAEESPTRRALHCLRCAEGQLLGCGAGGVLISRINGRLKVIAEAEENLYSVELFRGRVYAAGLRAVYVMEGNRLTELDMGLGVGFSSGHLSAADGVLWSVGARHLAFSEDGVRWQQIFYRGRARQ